MAKVKYPLRIWGCQTLFDLASCRWCDWVFSIPAQTIAANLKGANAFLQGFLKGSANGHDLAYGFHGRCQIIPGFREFLESPSWNFDYAIINGWLKRRHRLAGDIIGDFIQRIAHGQLGCNFGNGIPSRLGSKGGAAGYPGIHLHHDHFAGIRMNGKLHIGSAGIHADFPNDGNGGVSHQLIFFIGQGLGGRHGDAVSCMNPHRIHVFNGTDDHYIVVTIPHDLKLIFFPSQNRFLKHYLSNHACIKPCPGNDI